MAILCADGIVISYGSNPICAFLSFRIIQNIRCHWVCTQSSGNTFFIHTTSLGIVGAKIVLFLNKSSKDVIFVELEFVVLHGSSLTQSVVVQFPFSHFVVILVRNCV
jgi:hypothetical protein